MKKLFKVTFISEKHEQMQLYAQEVHASEVLGFVEVNRLVFIDSSDVIINPEDDKIRNLFKNTKRVLFPVNSILRIEEVTMDNDSPVIRIYTDEENT